MSAFNKRIFYSINLEQVFIVKFTPQSSQFCPYANS